MQRIRESFNLVIFQVYTLFFALDARKSVDESIVSYQTTLQLSPKDSVTMGQLCIAFSQRARLEIEYGKNPLPLFTLGIQQARNAIHVNPNYGNYYAYLGAAKYWKAEYEMNHGLNPSSSLNEATDAYAGYIKISHDDAEGYSNISEALNLKSEFLILTGVDAFKAVKQAIEYGEKGSSLAPDFDFASVNLGIAYANLAEAEINDAAAFRNAEIKSKDALQRTLKINSEYPEAHFTLGRLELLSSIGIEDLNGFDRARSHFREAMRLNPKYEKAQWLIAESYLLEGERKLLQKGSAEKEIEEGLKFCDDGKIKDAYLLASKGGLLWLKARNASTSQTRDQATAESKQWLNEALRMNTNLKTRYIRFL